MSNKNKPLKSNRAIRRDDLQDEIERQKQYQRTDERIARRRAKADVKIAEVKQRYGRRRVATVLYAAYQDMLDEDEEKYRKQEEDEARRNARPRVQDEWRKAIRWFLFSMCFMGPVIVFSIWPHLAGQLPPVWQLVVSWFVVPGLMLFLIGAYHFDQMKKAYDE